MAGFLQRAVDLALAVQEATGSKKLADFVAALDRDEEEEHEEGEKPISATAAAATSAPPPPPAFRRQVEELKRDVEAFAENFPMPGPAQGGPIP